MKKNEYLRMEERESVYWWHTGRLEIIKSYLGRAINKPVKILNIGCGTGGTLGVLEGFGIVDNVDVSEDALLFMKKKGYKRLTKVDDVRLPFKDKSYDVVGAFDVLEHIDDQVGALREWHRVLKPAGSVVLTVPAYQWLWSEHDVSLHHKRRYTISSLRQASNEAGFVIDKVSYAIVFSLPLVVGFRVINKILGRQTDAETSYVEVPRTVNVIFHNLLKLEAKLHKKFRFPFGTSVVAILRKV